MPKLLDLFRFADRPAPLPHESPSARRDDAKLRRDECEAAILATRYPVDGADIESISEYRLASLLQYPHY